MKRVLVVSPSFPPISAADLHRVRTSLPFYPEFGWQPFVLAVDAVAHGGLQEPELLATVPKDILVTRCGAIPATVTRAVGVGAVGLRALPQLYAAGAALIRQHHIDLVYFSTTMFPAVVLGRLWKARFGTPYVIDMQDPWKTDYRGAGLQPGVKAGAARAMHGRLEPFAMRRVDGIITVSPSYADVLQQRYPWIHPDMCATIPFGASVGDIDAARALPWTNTFFDRHDGHLYGVSVGRGGRDLARAAEILFTAVQRRDDQDGQPGRTRLAFVGTDYASHAGHRTIEPVAAAAGAAAMVEEWPARLPYLQGLRLLSDAHFCVMLGSDDPAYSPSKVYPYLMTGRPFVAVLHEASPVLPLLRQSGSGIVATFGDAESTGAVASRLAEVMPWAIARANTTVVPPESLLEAVGAREMTRRQCLSFEAAVRHASPQGVPCVE
jgi:hypothetical protein